MKKDDCLRWAKALINGNIKSLEEKWVVLTTVKKSLANCAV
jgi:hypothetical protein